MNTPVQRIEFKPEYTPALLISSATALVRGYLFASYGKWLVVACVINAAGFTLGLWAGARGVPVWVVGAIALLGPLWLANFYFRYPARFASRASGAGLVTRIALTPEKIELTTKDGSASFSWSRFKAVVEAPTAFLLVLSPFAFLPLPKQGMPQEAISALTARKSRNVA